MLSDSEVTAHTWVLGRMGRHRKGAPDPGQGITGSGSIGSAGDLLGSSQEPSAANSTGSAVSRARLDASPRQVLSAGLKAELSAGAVSQQAPRARLHAPGAAVGLRSLQPAAKHQHKAPAPGTGADVTTAAGHQAGAPALTDLDRAGTGAPRQPSSSRPKQGLLNLAETPLAHWTGQAVPAGAAGSTGASPGQVLAREQHAGFCSLSQPAAQPGASSAGAPAAPADEARWAASRAVTGLAQAQAQDAMPAGPCEAAAPGAAAEPPVKLTINIIEGARACVQLGAPSSDKDPQAGDAADMFASAQQPARHPQLSDEGAKRFAALSEVLAKLQPGLEPGELDLAQLQRLLHSSHAEVATGTAKGAAGPSAALLLPAVPGEASGPEARGELDPAVRQGLLLQAQGWDVQQGSSLMDVVADFSQLTSSVDLLDRLTARSAAQIAAHHAARRERAAIGAGAHGSAGSRPQQGPVASEQAAGAFTQAGAVQLDAGTGCVDADAEESRSANQLANWSQPATSDISLKQLARQSAGVRQAAKRSGCAVQQQGQQGAAAGTSAHDPADAAAEGSSAGGQAELSGHNETPVGAPGDCFASSAGGQGHEGAGMGGDSAGGGAAAPAVPPPTGGSEAPGPQRQAAERAAGNSAWGPGLTGSPQASSSGPQGGGEVGTGRKSRLCVRRPRASQTLSRCSLSCLDSA